MILPVTTEQKMYLAGIEEEEEGSNDESRRYWLYILSFYAYELFQLSNNLH